MTAQELLIELRKFPKYWAIAYTYKRHYMFYVTNVINNNKDIRLSCDIGNPNILTVRQLASKLLKYNLDMPIKIGHDYAYQVDKIRTLFDLVLITTKWQVLYIKFIRL